MSHHAPQPHKRICPSPTNEDKQCGPQHASAHTSSLAIAHCSESLVWLLCTASAGASWDSSRSPSLPVSSGSRRFASTGPAPSSTPAAPRWLVLGWDNQSPRSGPGRYAARQLSQPAGSRTPTTARPSSPAPASQLTRAAAHQGSSSTLLPSGLARPCLCHQCSCVVELRCRADLPSAAAGGGGWWWWGGQGWLMTCHRGGGLWVMVLFF